MSHEPYPQLDEYLDGLLSDPDRAAFETRMQADPQLQALVERQRHIDEALKRRFGPPPMSSALREVGQSNTSRQAVDGDGSVTPARRVVQTRGFGGQGLKVAAVLAIFVFAGWRLWNTYGPEPELYPPRPWQSLTQVYQESVEAGLKPDWVCKTDEEFAASFGKQLGQPLVLGQTPAGVDAVGLSYCNSISPRTLILLARVNDRPVLVLVDRADRDAGQTLPPDSALKLFSRTVDQLVLYEITPLAEPNLLELFHRPK